MPKKEKQERARAQRRATMGVPEEVAVPENTSQRVPSIFQVFGAMGLPPGAVPGGPNFIENQEKEGQGQFVMSDTIPVQLNGCTEAQLLALGFKLGPIPTTGDTIFRPARLPNGWKKTGTGHAMWSDIVDEKGFARCAVFYKAAFYDRSAHLSLNVRITMREDYKARDTDGTLAFDVRVMMPGRETEGEDEGCQCSKVVHRFVYPEKLGARPAHEAPESERRAFWDLQDAARNAADAWVRENYPEARDPAAYWDREF